jgi:hypothetical protein
VVFLAFRVLGTVRALPGMAEIVNMFTRVFIELYHFLIVMLLVVLSFGLALYARLSERSRQWWESPETLRPCEWVIARKGAPRCEMNNDYSTFTSVVVSAWGVMLGDFETDAFQEQAVDVLLFFGFTFLISVLLLNLIIAVISEHHARVSSMRIVAWRESLAWTICDVDLLMNWWCTTSSVQRAKRCGGRQADATIASSAEIAWLERHRRWKRLPIDWACSALEQDVDCEPHPPMATLVLAALGGAATGAALGAVIGRHVGARSTGAAIAIPVGAMSTAVFRSCLYQCVKLSHWLAQLNRGRPRSHGWRQAEQLLLGRRRKDEFRPARAQVATDVVVMLASGAAFCGTLVGYDLHDFGIPFEGGPGAGFLAGAAFATLSVILFHATRMSARSVFTLSVLFVQLTLAVCVSVAFGAAVAFVLPGDKPTRVSSGGFVGGIVCCALYITWWLGGVAATLSAFGWLWLPRGAAAMSIIGAACTSVLLLWLHTAFCFLHAPTSLRTTSRARAANSAVADSAHSAGPPSPSDQPPSPVRSPAPPLNKAAGRSSSHVSLSTSFDNLTRSHSPSLSTLHYALELLFESHRTLHSLMRTLLREITAKRMRHLMNGGAAAAGTAAALLCTPYLVPVERMSEEAQTIFRVLLGTCLIAFGSLLCELLRESAICPWLLSRPSCSFLLPRSYKRMLDESHETGKPNGAAASPNDSPDDSPERSHAAARVPAERRERLRWIHVLATRPSDLCGRHNLSF